MRRKRRQARRLTTNTGGSIKAEKGDAGEKAEEVGAEEVGEGKVEKIEDSKSGDDAKVEAVDSPADHPDT